MNIAVKQDAAQAGLNTGDFDEKNEVPNTTLALTDSDAMNKLAFSPLAIQPDWVKNELQGPDGMTPAERAQYEEQQREEAFARAENQMAENERLYNEQMQRLRWEDEQICKEIKQREDETWHHKGKAIFKDPATGKYIDQDGNVLEGEDEDAAKSAEASGQHIGDYNPYKAAKDRHTDNQNKQGDLTGKFNDDMAAYNNSVANGDAKGATAAAADSKQLLEKAHADAVDITKTADANMQDSQGASIVAATSIDSGRDDFNAARAHHRTSYASQIDPVVSDRATIKPEFTASASPAPSISAEPVLSGASPNKPTGIPTVSPA